MIEPGHRRICGFHIEDDGLAAAVWIAHDRYTDVARLYDACLFRREVLAVIAEGLCARGRWIPVAWSKDAKSLADKLTERGCNMIMDPAEDDDAMAEVIARDVWGRMRSGRFKVDPRLMEWRDEHKVFFRDDAKVPRAGFPLMSATRHAIQMFDGWARPEVLPGARKSNAPTLTIV